MSGEPAIIFDHVSKVYHKRAGMGTLFSMIPGIRHRHSDEFWALKDVSFEVKRGECLGIIGPNGAGKSTILKILSRITSPTSGSFRVNGRLSSLIEVGAGFHPELTGRENVYLNAAILGMSKKETDAKFEDIVDFAELWDFIDVPVKRYSSGMYVRLGFSVAVHTAPEVLLVDEVLAVGDAQFQSRCMDRIRSFRNRSGTIVFVSHNLTHVSRMCDRLLLMNKGAVVAEGDPVSVCSTYQGALSASRRIPDRPDPVVEFGRSAARMGSGDVLIEKVRLLDATGKEVWRTPFGSSLSVEISYRAARPVEGVEFSVGIFRPDGVLCFAPFTGWDGYKANPQGGTVTLFFPRFLVIPGAYEVSVSAWNKEMTVPFDLHERLYPLVVDGRFAAEGIVPLEHVWK